MEDSNARENIVRLSARILALREVIIRLLANESERSGDPTANFENYSDALDARIYTMMQQESLPEHAIEFQELVRKEVDWIVGAAQKIVSAPKDR